MKQSLAANGKRKREAIDAAIPTRTQPSPKMRQLSIQSALSSPKHLPPSPSAISSCVSQVSHQPETENSDLATLITTSNLTQFRQRVLLALCQVPRGRFTTYAALSDHLHSSARAVGNGLRNNPFAPRVPCHRVIAADKSLGGFGGDWGKEGRYAGEKVRLLREEGVIVDMDKWRVTGEVWKAFRCSER